MCAIVKMVRPKLEREIRQCLNCGKDFEVIITSKKKFCNHKCHHKWMSINQRGKNNSNYGNHPIPWNIGLKRVNGNCGAPKGTIPWNKEKKYEQISGENHYNWQGGKSFEPYSLDWIETLKRSIRERDYYVCQECGIHQDELNRKLDIHHIDYNKKNCDPENLITLCRSCHMKTNYNREYWINYFKNKKVKCWRKIK